jgi:hypothetical protein
MNGFVTGRNRHVIREIPQQRQEVIVKIFSGAQTDSGFSPGYRIKTISLPCGFLVMAMKRTQVVMSESEAESI